MDRFERGLPDPQEAKVLGYCDECGAEIYAGESIWRFGSDRFCKKECLCMYIGAVEIAVGDE